MKIRVNEGWDPGILFDDKLYAPGKELELPDEQARQFLDNGSAIEVKPARSSGSKQTPSRSARKGR